MPKSLKLTIIACLSLIVTTSFAQSQQDLVSAIDQQLIPLKTLSPGADFGDLTKLKTILKDKPIVGIGEATHGTHEFFVFKHRMLEFLVKEMGFKTFVIEGDFAGTQIMNDYVLSGKGDMTKGLWGIGFGVWMTQEFVDMVNWVKAYNETQSAENKVRFFGCDMQWGSAAMKLMKDYLTKTNEFTPEMNTAFEAMKKYTPLLTGKEKAAIRNTVRSLANIQFTGVDTALYCHDVRKLQQVVELIDSKSTLFPAKQTDVRDKRMAENVEWIYNYTGHNKMMLWAHNAHIGKSAGSQKLQRMGMWLAKKFGNKYYTMGFDFYDGKMRSVDQKAKQFVVVSIPAAKEGSSGAMFAQCSAPNFILDCKSASANERINAFLNKGIPSIFIGPTYEPGKDLYYTTHKLSETYDAIIFIKDTHASMDIKKESDGSAK